MSRDLEHGGVLSDCYNLYKNENLSQAQKLSSDITAIKLPLETIAYNPTYSPILSEVQGVPEKTSS